MRVEKSFDISLGYNNSNKLNYFYINYSERIADRLYCSLEELEDFKSKLDKINKNEGKGKLGKTVYIGKGSNIPRHKVKAFIEDKNIKKTTFIEKSDTVVFDRKVISELCNLFDRFKKVEKATIPFTKELLEGILKINEEEGYSLYNSSKDELIKFYEKNAKIVLSKNKYISLPEEIKNIIGEIKFENIWELALYRDKYIVDLIETLEYYFTNPHNNIIWDDIILESINNDGIDLDEEYIDTLNSMFSSKESSNIRLAIEMLSNVNLEKDGLTIALFLNRYKDLLTWGSGNTTSQAFKTLNRYFINKGINWDKDWRDFSAGLYKNYSSNIETKKIIDSFILSNINKYLENSNEKYCLQIKGVDIGLFEKVRK